MNIGDIQERFIRAAEIDRNTREHVGPAPLRAQQLPYVHDWLDKAGWRKEVGDKLEAKADPYADERKAFWERVSNMPTSAELSQLSVVFDWLVAVGNEPERRALLAWARSKAGGKSFRRWCFKVEGIHPETGRRRKNRALEKIRVQVARRAMQNDGNREIRVLSFGHEISDLSDTIAEDVGERDKLNSWLAPGAFAADTSPETFDFSWADKRNERRRQQEARRRKEQAREAA